MKENKYLIKQAQDAYNKGNYETSILLYQKAIEQYPKLAKILQFNLDFINQKKCNLIKNLPSVTTIIVAYNHEKYIAQCLESVIKQNYPKHNIIIFLREI